MLFHTWHFALFFVVVYLGHLLLRGAGLHLWWLLAASYFFYGWWNPLYLVLIAYSTGVDYFVVVAMERSKTRKTWLALSITNSLLLLGFFKYGAFVANTLNALLTHVGAPISVPAPDILLPVGISFYVFQSMSYTIDFYRGKIEREPSLLRYATFVSLFPQLVAGPIERAKNLLPQLTGRPRISGENIGDGLSLFVVGLFKKVALADYLALYVDRVYAAPGLFDSSSLSTAPGFTWTLQ